MKRKREIIKRVIAYMTLGIDVSRLFTDMIMVGNHYQTVLYSLLQNLKLSQNVFEQKHSLARRDIIEY
jgi:hypothetical protein